VKRDVAWYFFRVGCDAAAKHLPKSFSPYSFGSRQLRRLGASVPARHVGKGVNIERNAAIGHWALMSAGGDSGIGINSRIGAVTLEKRVMVGPDCIILMSIDQHNRTDIPMQLQGYSDVNPFLIEDDVWIGARVTRLPGVHIGEGSIVGASLVTTKDIPPCSIAVGNPARVVKNRKTSAENNREALV
jgi:maltose O-acetyltransferase